jgi:hydrogenase maturation protease
MSRAATVERSLLVIGIGNPDRGDDGIGPMIVRQLLGRQLAGRVSPEVAIIERRGDALALIDDWAGRDAVILVDASARGTTPGRVHRIDLLADALPPELGLSSTHAFGVAEAVGLANTLGLLPAQVIAYAVEGANFDPGAPVSPEVAAVAGDVASRVAAELRRMQEVHSLPVMARPDRAISDNPLALTDGTPGQSTDAAVPRTPAGHLVLNAAGPANLCQHGARSGAPDQPGDAGGAADPGNLGQHSAASNPADQPRDDAAARMTAKGAVPHA